MFIVFFVCRFLCIYKKKEMRRKMFIKNIVYKKWYIVFCVYANFINLCKKTLTSRNAPNFLRAKIFYTFFILFLFQSAYKAQKFLFFDKFQSALIKIQANTTQKAQKTKKLHKKREQPPSGRQKAQKKRINIDNRAKKC